MKHALAEEKQQMLDLLISPAGALIYWRIQGRPNTHKVVLRVGKPGGYRTITTNVGVLREMTEQIMEMVEAPERLA